MAVLKLSQISASGANFTSGDFLVAVQGGTTDVLFTPEQVFAFANLVYASNVLEQRNASNAQTFRVYNTFSNSSNYERGVFDWATTSNTLTIGVQNLGSGSVRGLNIVGGHGTTFLCTTTEIFGCYDTFVDATNKVGIGSGTVIGFSSSGSAGGTMDVALSRNGAGILEINSGSPGTFRDLKLRTLIGADSTSFTANSTTATILGSVGPAGANTTVQKWLTIKDGSGGTFYIPCF